MSDTPFADRMPPARPAPRDEVTPEGPRPEDQPTGQRYVRTAQSVMPLPSVQRTLAGDVADIYLAAVDAVAARFTHLSADDITHPPHGLFDAHLCRQIALHVAHEQLGVPKRRLAEDLERSREAVNRALAIIEQRLVKEEFAATYAVIAQLAKQNIINHRAAK